MEAEVAVIPAEVSLSMQFVVQEPFIKEELTKLLIKQNFEEIPGPERIEELGAERVSIVKKRGCLVKYDQTAGRIETSCKKCQQALTTFEEVESILRDDDDIFSQIRSYEFSSRSRVSIKKINIRPLEAISKFSGSDKFHKLNKITGVELAPFCIRCCPKEKMGVIESFRETVNWLDLYIFPHITNPKYFSVWLVYRDKDEPKVKKFAKESENLIKRVINALIEDKGDG